jgi:hypothetical protein
MKTKTELAKFKEHLRRKDFKIYASKDMPGCFTAFGVIPAHHRVDPNGNHYLLSGIKVSVVRGRNTESGKIGTMTASYSGTTRRNRSRRIFSVNAMQEGCCPVTAEAAIKDFVEWERRTWAIVNSWRQIL